MATSTIRDSAVDIALGIVKRRMWSGIAVFVTTLSLAIPIAMFLPDVYRGVTTVLIENQDASAAFARGAVPELETRMMTIQQELLSRTRLSRLIKELNLYPSWRRHATMEAVVEKMRRDIHVELARTDRGRPTTIGLKISYIGLDPKSSAAVPNALAQLYVDENTRMREGQTTEMARFLKTQLDDSRAQVDIQEHRVNEFKQAHGGELPEQVSINMIGLERLNQRLRQNADDQQKVRDRQQRAAGITTSDTDLDPVQALKAKLADLQSRYTDQHPDVIRAKAQLADLEREVAAKPATPRRAVHVPTTDLDNELATLKREEARLRADIAESERRIQTAPTVSQQLEQVERDYSSAKESYTTILKRFEEAQLADSMERTKSAESFRILDPAVLPAFPAAPNRMRLLILACFLAISAGIGTMILFEQLDTSFHSVGDLRQFTSVPVLASIPYVYTRPTIGGVLRIVLTCVAVAGLCVALAGIAYRTAQQNTQLVWMLSAPQL